MKNIMKFIGFTFLFSWLCWLPLVLQTQGVLSQALQLEGLKAIGAIMPMIIGLIITSVESGKEGIKGIIKNAFLKGVSLVWLIFVTITFFAVNGLSRFVFSFFESNLPVSEIVTDVPSFIFFTLLVFFLGGGLGEEIGWRGFLTEKLLSKYNPLKTIFLVSGIWTVWHLPLFYIGSSNQEFLGFIQFSLAVIALTVMITWVYVKTRSILLCTLFHTFGNVAHEVFRVVPTQNASSTLGFNIFTGIMLTISFLIIIFDQDLHSDQYQIDSM